MSEDIHAQLDWDAEGQPLSRTFGDVYFSRTCGIAETGHVFLNGNDLPRRMSNLTPHGRLCIGETGFGTGLNFLCAWRLFEQQAHPSARLHFVSVEKFPLSQTDLERALALWPELTHYSDALRAQYRCIHPGFQRLVFAGGRVTLTLLVGDVLEVLPELDARMDAWFLDGFSPARNPQMWNAEVFAQLARLSAPGASLATFTSAGFVRRGLQDAGFAMRKTPGFGKKWEMLCGHYSGPRPPSVKPWFARPAFTAAQRRALVIGGGLAGCASAASLAARGWQVTLLERHAQLASEASGNPQGVLYLKLSAHGTAQSQLVLSGFGYTRRLLEELSSPDDWQPCGVLQLAFDAAEQQRQQALQEAYPDDLLQPVDRTQAQAIAGIDLNAGGLFFAQAGWVNPPALCDLLSRHPQIQVMPHQNALTLRKTAEGWQALDADHLLACADVVVLAGAADVCQFAQTAHLPLKRIRGQISYLPATPASAALRTVICGEGYVAPARQGMHTLGASFDFKRHDLDLCAQEHEDNLEMLKGISADLAQRLELEQQDSSGLQGRVAFRCTSPDYLPLVGPLADHPAFMQCYAALGKNARTTPPHDCPWHDGLFLNSGHGSRGLITAPLAAELLAAWLEDEPLPLPRSVAEACHPNRFSLRSLIRGG
jgi:tRNA 5-methylaminomethyl-2-thiouridine biosynthesis bifunctional protein